MKYAFYDFSVAPYSYDFVQFMVCALAFGYERVVFVPGKRMVKRPDGTIEEFQKCSPEEQDFRMRHLLLPLCNDPIVCETREEARQYWTEECFPPEYTLEKPVEWHTLGHVMFGGRMKPIKAKPDALKRAREILELETVLITIRENPINTVRNCSVGAWKEAARWIRARGFVPAFIPDTAHLGDDFAPFRSIAEAAMDSALRLALYDTAMLNIGINTGPLSLCFFSRRPLLYFKPINPGQFVTTEQCWKEWGLPKGKQPPWFTKWQRIVWEPEDDAETIIKHVGAWLDMHEAEQSERVQEVASG